MRFRLRSRLGFCCLDRAEEQLHSAQQMPVRWCPQPVIAHFVHAFGRNVLEKPANEFERLQSHDAPTAFVYGSVSKANIVVADGKDATVRESHPMHVTTEIVENARGITPRGFAVNDPLLFPDSLRPLHLREFTLCQRHEPPAKHARQSAHRHEVVFATTDPVLTIGANAASRNQAMNMGVIDECASPGVQDGQHPDLRAEVFRIPCQVDKASRRSLHQDAIQSRLMSTDDSAQNSRNCKNDMEIGNGQELPASCFDPSLGVAAMALRARPVAARVVGKVLEATTAAQILMPAQSRRTATHNVAQRAPMTRQHRVAMLLEIARSVAAKDFRQLNHHDQDPQSSRRQRRAISVAPLASHACRSSWS